jgi:deoxyribodipyrimidine photolyase-related protein
MSHYKKGAWSDIWDALYWRWIIKNHAELKKNHRWAMMCSQVDKMEEDKKNAYLTQANTYLSGL